MILINYVTLLRSIYVIWEAKNKMTVQFHDNNNRIPVEHIDINRLSEEAYFSGNEKKEVDALLTLAVMGIDPTTVDTITRDSAAGFFKSAGRAVLSIGKPKIRATTLLATNEKTAVGIMADFPEELKRDLGLEMTIDPTTNTAKFLFNYDSFADAVHKNGVTNIVKELIGRAKSSASIQEKY